MSKDSAQTTSTATATSKLTPYFYDDQRGRLAIFCLSLLVLVGGFVLWGLFEDTIEPSPEVFPTTVDGKLTAPIPLTRSNLETPEVLQWVVEAITNSFTFNFVSYRKTLQQARMYFTQDGYMVYLKFLQDNGTIEQVVQQKYVLSVVPTGAPIILKDKPLPDGTFSWQIQFPIQINYHSAKKEAIQNLMLTMLVKRVPLDEARRGVAIAGIIIRDTSRGNGGIL